MKKEKEKMSKYNFHATNTERPSLIFYNLRLQPPLAQSATSCTKELPSLLLQSEGKSIEMS